MEGGSGHQIFLVMPNLMSKNFSEFFHLLSTLDSKFFRVGSGPTFFGHAKFEGVCGHQLFWVTPNLRSKIFSEIFHLPSILDSKFFKGRQSGHQLSLVTPNLRSKIFQNFLFTECSGLQIFQRGV